MNRHNHEIVCAVWSQVVMTATDVGERKSCSLKNPKNGPAGQPLQPGHAIWMSILTNSNSEAPDGMEMPSFKAASK